MAHPLDAEAFKALLGRFATGVTVITTSVSGVAHGMTASAFSSLSLDPPLVLVCVGKKQRTHRTLQEGRRFVVNILAEDQEHLSTYFSRPRPEGPEEFRGVPVRPGPRGIPYIEGCIANADCRVTAILPGGDHDIFVGEVEDIEVASAVASAPLLYFMGQYRRLPH